MNGDFTQALARAMENVRAQDLSQATAIIQAALGQTLPGQAAPAQATPGQAAPGGTGRPAPPTPEAARPPRRFRIAADATDAETVEAAPGPDAGPRVPRGERRSLREVVELLRAGRAAFDGPKPPLPTPGRSGSELPGQALSGLNLPKLDFSGLDLSGLNLPGLSGPDFSSLPGLSGLALPGAMAHGPAPALPEGARFEWRNHASPAGSRRYRLFVPSCPAEELQGLVLMLHGCKQNPDDFAAGTGMNQLAEDARMLVAWPEQPGGANVSGCWNWFEPAHQRRDAGEPAILADLARDLAAEFALPEGRTFAAGLSAGGAMAAVLAETYGDVFAAVGIHSGLAHGSARDVVSAFAAMRGQGSAPAPRRAGTGPRTIVFHGTADHTVSPGNAQAIAAGLGGTTAAPEAGTTAGRGWRRSHGAGNRLEVWLVEGAGHAWSGGHPSGSFTDPSGPSASAEMLRFFLAEG
jgi:poly(hydroxyalkanoate) depolymerase family esterase